jgi:RimJ/RimL family protein N-acetyltransferase
MIIDKDSLLLENDHICLRPLNIQDITDEYVFGLNDPEVNQFLVDVRRSVQTRESVKKYVQSSFETPTALLLGIFVKDDSKRMVGTIHISGIEFFHFTASIGVCLFARQFWKKGYALQAIRLVKEYLFGVIGLHYIEAGVYAKNLNSINVFTRAGFTEWYRVKDRYRHIDSFEEVICFAAINPFFDMSILRNP